MKKNELVEAYRKRVDSLLEKLEDIETIADQEDRETVDACFMGTLTIVEALWHAPGSAYTHLS